MQIGRRKKIVMRLYVKKITELGLKRRQSMPKGRWNPVEERFG